MRRLVRQHRAEALFIRLLGERSRQQNGGASNSKRDGIGDVRA